MHWWTFKALVKEIRKRNAELMKQERGSHRISLSITVFDGDEDFVHVNPHRIDLRDGVDFVKVGGDYKHLNIKKLLGEIK